MTTMQMETFSQADAVLADDAEDRRRKLRRKRLLFALGATVLKLGTGYWAFAHYYSSKFITTDNAYTAVETAQVTPAVGGIVSGVLVNDTQYVRKGEILVK